MAILKTSVALSLCLFQGVAGELNPTVTQFSDDITFHVDFDAGNGVPTLSGGTARPAKAVGNLSFCKGLFGQALQSGNLSYDAAGALDLSSPGTVIAWIAPCKGWDAKLDKSGFLFFLGKTDQWQLLIGRQAGIATIYTYFQRVSKAICLRGCRADSQTWPVGQWHMVAVSWSPDALSLSVDGQRFAHLNLAMSIGRRTTGFVVGNLYGDFPLLVDELVILNRRITDAEAEKAYRDTLKAAGAPRSGK